MTFPFASAVVLDFQVVIRYKIMHSKNENDSNGGSHE